MKNPISYLDIESTWKILLIWFGLVILVFSIAREWGVVAFGVTYGLVFGGLAYHFRHLVVPFFKRMGLYNYKGFLLICVIVSVTEETYCYLLGNRIAHPVLWIDLIVVTGLWTVWFGTWYFHLSKKYAFTEKEALMTAAFTGVLYEYIGTGYFLQNPLGVVLAFPLGVIVYAAIFVLPMQLIEFTGTNNSRMKYPVSIVLPFILTFPAAIVLFVLFSLAGYPLE